MLAFTLLQNSLKLLPQRSDSSWQFTRVVMQYYRVEWVQSLYNFTQYRNLPSKEFLFSISFSFWPWTQVSEYKHHVLEVSLFPFTQPSYPVLNIVDSFGQLVKHIRHNRFNNECSIRLTHLFALVWQSFYLLAGLCWSYIASGRSRWPIGGRVSDLSTGHWRRSGDCRGCTTFWLSFILKHWDKKKSIVNYLLL